MVKEATKEQERIAARTYLIYSAIFAVTAFFGLYGFGAARESSNVDLFKIYGGLSAIATLLIFGLEITRKKKERFIETIVHEPSNSRFLDFVPQLRNVFSMIFISFAFFLSIGLVVSLYPEIAAYVPETSIPISLHTTGLFASNIGFLILSVFPASPTETNIFINVIISLIVLIPIKILLFFIIRKPWVYTKIRENVFLFILFGLLLAFIGGIAGSFMHNYVYGSNAKALVQVYIFWALQTFVWWIFQSIIPAEIQHISVNFVKGLSGLFSSNGLLIFFLIFLILLNFLLFVISLSERVRNLFKQAVRI